MASVAFAAAGSIFSGVMAVRQGYAQQAAYEAAAGAQAEAASLETMQIEAEARAAQTQALQEESNRREALRRSLAASAAQAAAQGMSLEGSASFVAGMDDLRWQAEKDIDSIQLYAAQMSRKYEIARASVLTGATATARSYKSAGDAAVESGWIRAGTTMLDFGQKAYDSGIFRQTQGQTTGYKKQSGPRPD